MTIVLWILAAVLILMLVSGGYVFVVSCVRAKELPWLDRDGLQKTPYGRFYDHIVAGERWLKEHNAQLISTKSFDGVELCALWVPAEKPKATAMLIHGYRSCFMADFGLAFDMYHRMGFNLLLPYQRAHGKSKGLFITFGVKESRDMEEWIQLHNREFGEYPMLLSGLSMGASTVMYMADAQLPSNVFCLIADCGFTSPYEILSHVYKRTTHLPPCFSMWATELFARLFAGFSLKQKDSRKSLAGSRLPIALIHGGKDDFVPCNMSREAYEACTSAKRLLVVEDASHGVSYIKDKNGYREYVLGFIKENMRSIS